MLSEDVGEEAGAAEEPPVLDAIEEGETLTADEETLGLEPDIGEEAAVAAGAVAGAAASDDEETAEVEEKGKGRKKFGKKGAKAGKKSFARKAGGKGNGKKGKIGRKKDKAASKKAEKVRPAAPVSTRGSITFVCSECYEELLLSAQYSQDVVTCPECLHVGKRPDEDFIRTVQMHKGGEKKSLTWALVCGALFAVVVLALFYVQSPYYMAGNDWQPAAEEVTMGLLGGAGILGALLIWLIVRSEGNRWEVYF
jgi:hypothetical protein